MAITLNGTTGITTPDVDSSADISANGLTVGRGAGSISTNTAVGASALQANTTGSTNTAIGNSALQTNTVAARNTAVGYQAGYTNNANDMVAVGSQAAYSNTTGASNTAIGRAALYSNTLATNNTALGFQAGYTYNRTADSDGYNTFIGNNSGYSLTTGQVNTLVGHNAGNAMTTGSYNSILGSFSGNSSNLDIRTASNYIVLSDGAGVPHAFKGPSTFGYVDSWVFGTGGTGTSGTGTFYLNGSSASGWQPNILARGNGTAYWEVGTKGWQEGTSSTFLQCKNAGFGGGVYLNGAGATSWTSASDERLKENLVEITDAASKVSTLRAVIGNYTWDEEKTRRPFLIAQDVQAVLPEAVSASPSETLGEELGVSYTEVIPLLVAAIKEQQAIITDLKSRIEALEQA